MIKRFFYTLVLTAISTAGLLPIIVSARVDVNIHLNAPPPRGYVIPRPRPGYIWAPGYWNLAHSRRVWIPGSWLPERPGYIYHPARWVQGPQGWHFSAGAWHRPRRLRPAQRPPQRPPHHRPPRPRPRPHPR